MIKFEKINVEDEEVIQLIINEDKHIIFQIYEAYEGHYSVIFLGDHTLISHTPEDTEKQFLNILLEVHKWVEDNLKEKK